MSYETSWGAVAVFMLFVGSVLALSFYMGRKAKSAKGYYAAHGQINWFVNGVAFAGDYLSAASFLGICGMIAFFGYDGFLYSIGYLAGWVVALFVIAEPLKRLGKFTFADALDKKFNSRGIKLAAAISTLLVSLFYLIPQMVGAGALVQPLLGLPFWAGVIIVGAVVIVIVVTAGMVSTTWVQFIKGSLLVIFCTILTFMILRRGVTTKPDPAAKDPRMGIRLSKDPDKMPATGEDFVLAPGDKIIDPAGDWEVKPYIRVKPASGAGQFTWKYDLPKGTDLAAMLKTKGRPAVVQLLRDRLRDPATRFTETQTLTEKPLKPWLGFIPRPAEKFVNEVPQGHGPGQADLYPIGKAVTLPDGRTDPTGPLGPVEFLGTIQGSQIMAWRSELIKEKRGGDEIKVYVYSPVKIAGQDLMQPGGTSTFAGIKSPRFLDRIDFISLMLALFCGTASLPHILIRYYTVKDGAAARKSTVVGIASIGFFYVLTLFLGLGAMTSGRLDVTNDTMSAPLLAKSFNETLFAIISAIAFTTVLGTVSGLILAASGAVAHDLMSNFLGMKMSDQKMVRAGKVAAVVVGVVAMVLGVLFQEMNPTFLVGWAFNVAASANLPALVMLLFWKRTTKKGITAAIVIGLVSSLGWLLLSGPAYEKVYHLPKEQALAPFSQPGIVTIPLGFLVLIGVSLMTKRKNDEPERVKESVATMAS